MERLSKKHKVALVIGGGVMIYGSAFGVISNLPPKPTSSEDPTANRYIPLRIEPLSALSDLPTPLLPISTETPVRPVTSRENIMEKVFINPLREIAMQKRAAKELDPINKDRINFLILGIRGTEEEPALTDSIQIISLNHQTNTFDMISLHRDTEAPEITRFLKSSYPFRINAAYLLGGFPLTGKSVEGATDLHVDFTMLMKGAFLEKAVEKIFGNKLKITLDQEINDQNMGYFPQGEQILEGEAVLRLARARYYGTNYNRNLMQQEIIKAMLSSLLESNIFTKAIMTRQSIDFFNSAIADGSLETDFVSGILTDISGNLLRVIWEGSKFELPASNSTFIFSQETGTLENAGDPTDPYRLKFKGGEKMARQKVKEVLTN